MNGRRKTETIVRALSTWRELWIALDWYDRDQDSGNPEITENLRDGVIAAQDQISILLEDYGIDEQKAHELTQSKHQDDWEVMINWWLSHIGDEDA